MFACFDCGWWLCCFGLLIVVGLGGSFWFRVYRLRRWGISGLVLMLDGWFVAFIGSINSVVV